MECLLEHLFMKENERMGSCIERIGNFGLFGFFVDDIVHNADDGLGEIIEVKNRRISVQANGVELVAILNQSMFTRMMSYVSQPNNTDYQTLLPLPLASSIFARTFYIFAILSLAIPFLSLIRSLVSVESFIPRVDDTYFSLFSVNRMMTFRQLSYYACLIVQEMHCLLNFSNYYPSACFSRRQCSQTPYHLTKPPYTALAALPDPQRASLESSFSSKIPPKRPLSAVARQEKPDAEEAIPEAVGKLFSDLIWKWYCFHSSSLRCSNDLLFRAASLILPRTFLIRPPMSISFPLSQNQSFLVSFANEQVVIVERSSVLRVIPIESLIGRISSSSYLPQYFTRAMLGDERQRMQYWPYELSVISIGNLIIQLLNKYQHIGQVKYASYWSSSQQVI